MRKKILFWIALCLLAGGGAYGWTHWKGQEAGVRYRTVRVERGPLSTYVTANGTVNPVVTVLVGTQVSGTIQKLYADFNSPVKEGELIAQIDPAVFQAQHAQARAKLENTRAASLNAQADVATARSNLESSRANVTKARVAVEDTRRSLSRSIELFQRNLISAADRDSAQTAFDSAQAQLEAALAQGKAGEAQLESARARLESARAQIKQAEAEVQLAQVNLDHTRITAPVTGIVVSRNVDVGQTVAASLQTPTLFTIAKDLTQMQVDTNVSEADIGRVAVGQEAFFTVDAFPQLTFRGRVTEIRNAPATIQNVVTYNVVIRVRNPELRLRPGMTANASILVAHREDALKVSNAALRYRPESARREAAEKRPPTPAPPPSTRSRSGLNLERLKTELDLSPEQLQRAAGLLQATQKEMEAARRLQPEEARRKTQELRGAAREKIRALLNAEQRKKFDRLGPAEGVAATPVYKVWVPAPQGQPAPVEITTGISDGTFTEVLSGDLKEGREVIVEAQGGKGNTGNARVPAPSMRGFR